MGNNHGLSAVKGDGNGWWDVVGVEWGEGWVVSARGTGRLGWCSNLLGSNQRHSQTFTVWSTLPVTTYGAALWKSVEQRKGVRATARGSQERESHFIGTGNQHFILRFEYLDSLINSLVRGVQKQINMINSLRFVHAPPQLQTNNKKVFCIHTHTKL